MSRHPRTTVLVCIFLVGWAWMWCTPPSDAPDEASHYVRMVGLSDGSLFGRGVAPDAPVTELFTDAPEGVARERLNLESGDYDLPAEAAPASACNQFDGGRPYDCVPAAATNGTIVARSFHARSLPTSYAIPALLSSAGESTSAKSLWGRAGYLLQAVLLLGLAAAAASSLVARRGHGWSLIILSVTPLATYQLATLSPSGTEWAAAMAFTACLLRLLHEPRRRWQVATVATATLCLLTRDLGLFIVPMAIGIVACGFPRQAIDLARSERRFTVFAIAGVGLGWLAAIGWRLWVQAPSGSPEVSGSVLSAIVRHSASLALFSVGRIGWLVTTSGLVVSAVWCVGAAVMLWLATLGTRPRLRALLATATCWLLLNGVLEAAFRPTGFGVQARYGLPVLSLGLLVVATIPTARPATAKTERRALHACGWASALGHLVSMVTMIWRHTQGLWHRWPFADPAWAPPIGWAASSCFVVLAVASIALMPRLSTDDDVQRRPTTSRATRAAVRNEASAAID